jgi:hypothetical protein
MDHKYQMSRPSMFCFCSYLVPFDGFSVPSALLVQITQTQPSQCGMVFVLLTTLHRLCSCFAQTLWPFCNL